MFSRSCNGGVGRREGGVVASMGDGGEGEGVGGGCGLAELTRTRLGG